MNCKKCNNQISRTNKICTKCGKKIIIIRSKVDEWLENQIGRVL